MWEVSGMCMRERPLLPAWVNQYSSMAGLREALWIKIQKHIIWQRLGLLGESRRPGHRCARCQTIPVGTGHFYALKVLGKSSLEFPGLGAAVFFHKPKCSNWLLALCSSLACPLPAESATTEWRRIDCTLMVETYFKSMLDHPQPSVSHLCLESNPAAFISDCN